LAHGESLGRGTADLATQKVFPKRKHPYKNFLNEIRFTNTLTRNLSKRKRMHIFVTRNLSDMDIKEFLRSHPLINAYSIEKALGLNVGTIRLNSERAIPEMHLAAIKELLSPYGYAEGAKELPVVKQVEKSTGSKYFTRKGKDGSYICYKDVIVRPVMGIPDDTPVYLEL
jgi:hypothetical protein